MTDNDKLRSRQLAEALRESEPQPSGADWLQQMLPRFAIVTQGAAPDGTIGMMATHYGVGLPSGQVILFTLGVGTLAVLPDWDLVHQLVRAGDGRMVLVMEEQEVRIETETVA